MIFDKLNMQLSGLFAFTRELVLRPSSMGAACPSSKYLARAMAQHISLPMSGSLIELGAGTGVVTAALLEHGVQPRQLLVIEQSAALCQHLQNYFPQINVLHGDAQHLSNLLQAKAGNVSAIVSSLPLLSLPAEIASTIQQQIYDVLQPGGLYIQYTYQLSQLKKMPAGFKHLSSRRIWLNLPPARIDVFQRL